MFDLFLLCDLSWKCGPCTLDKNVYFCFGEMKSLVYVPTIPFLLVPYLGLLALMIFFSNGKSEVLKIPSSIVYQCISLDL